MPEMPAICDTCGTIFRSGFSFGSSFGVLLRGNKSGPCPRCGDMGHVPDGLYNFVGDVIQVLSAPARTIDELRRLEDILRRARAAQKTQDEVAEEIRKEVPSLTPLAALLPRNRSELYTFLALVASAVQLILTLQPQASGNVTIQNVTINPTQVIEQTIIQASPAAAAAPPSKPTTARNDPCPCGSGKKYKHCHGKIP